MEYQLYEMEQEIGVFEIRSVEHRLDGSLLFLTNQVSLESSRVLAIRFDSYDAFRVMDESLTLLLNQKLWGKFSGENQIFLVHSSDWIQEIERQSFDGCLESMGRQGRHFIICDSEWVYDIISYDAPEVVELPAPDSK